MTTTTVDDPELAEGVPFSERQRFVGEADPAIVATLERACQEYHQHEESWQEECARHQRNAGMPKRSLQSPFGKALNEAAAAVVEKFEELLAAGAVTYAGFRSGQLGGDPQAIPLALLAGKRPRGSRCTVRGVTFHDVKLYVAADLSPLSP